MQSIQYHPELVAGKCSKESSVSRNISWTPELKVKAQKGHNDADACLTAPLVLGVADGVSQIEVWRVLGS